MSPTRRQILQALGLTAGSLFLPSRGLATTATPPRRILFFMSSHGTVYDNWKMRPGGVPDDQDWTADLTALATPEWSPILAPLAHHASKLMILDGLAHGPSIPSATNEHDEGHATVLTGDLPVLVPGGIAIASGPSLDQVLGATRTTPFRTLEYTVRYGWSPCFDAQGNRIQMEGNTMDAWDRLFGGGIGSQATPTAGLVEARQHSVMDAAAGRFNALIPTLSGDDRIKLETHRDLIRDLEGQLQALQGLVCDAPDRPTSYNPPALEQMTAFQHMAVSAMACGLTDIVTIRAGDVTNADINAPAGDLHNDYAHNTYQDATAASIMTDFHTWYATRFAELLDLLDSIPENGGTMLDNTVVVWCNEIATGHHTHTDMPIVIAGAPDVLNTGNLIRWAPSNLIQGPWSTPFAGPPHNKLLVSLANVMGDPRNSMGVTELGLAGGGVLDCTGPLDRVCL